MCKSMEGGVKSLICTMIHSPNEINREINGEILGIIGINGGNIHIDIPHKEININLHIFHTNIQLATIMIIQFF